MNSYFLCRTQYENLGDLIINKMLVDELCRHGKVFVNTATVPQSFSKPLLSSNKSIDVSSIGENINSSFNLFSFFLRKNIKLCTSSPGPVFDSVKRSLRYRFLTFISNRLYNLFGVQRYYIGVCCSNLAITKADFYSYEKAELYARSLNSVEYLKKYIGNKHVNYIPDLCFLLHYQVKPNLKKKITIFDIRLSDNNNAELLQWCTSMAEKFLIHNFTIIIYYQVERDYNAAKGLYELLKGRNVVFRENIVWYEDMDFYADKMYVVSNRLHSLLIGAAYDVFPICLYQESISTAKLKDVFLSSFTDKLPIMYENGAIPECNLLEMYEGKIEVLRQEYSRNALLCREVINSIITNRNK